MSKQPRVYLAGKMRGLKEFGFPLFDAAKRQLESQGYEVISPADMDRMRGFNPAGLEGTDKELEALGFDTRMALRRDFEEILGCDAVALLSNWQESTGARLEKELAEACGIPTFLVEGEGAAPGAATNDPSPSTILDEAKTLVYGDREASYGHPRQDFARSAQMMSAMLGMEVRSDQVPLLMMAVKLSRLCERYKHDSVVDLAGYAATLARVMEE